MTPEEVLQRWYHAGKDSDLFLQAMALAQALRQAIDERDAGALREKAAAIRAGSLLLDHERTIARLKECLLQAQNAAMDVGCKLDLAVAALTYAALMSDEASAALAAIKAPSSAPPAPPR